MSGDGPRGTRTARLLLVGLQPLAHHLNVVVAASAGLAPLQHARHTRLPASAAPPTTWTDLLGALEVQHEAQVGLGAHHTLPACHAVIGASVWSARAGQVVGVAREAVNQEVRAAALLHRLHASAHVAGDRSTFSSRPIVISTGTIAPRLMKSLISVATSEPDALHDAVSALTRQAQIALLLAQQVTRRQVHEAELLQAVSCTGDA